LVFIAISASFYANFDAAWREEARPGARIEINVRDEVSPLNRPDAGLGESVQDAAAEASTQAFQLAALVAALLCFAGAAVNGVGIRNEQLHGDEGTAPAEAGTQPA
jgi:hypothetical protein